MIELVTRPVRKLLMPPDRITRYLRGDLGQPDEAFVLVADSGWLGPQEVALDRCMLLMAQHEATFGSIHDVACDIAIAEGDTSSVVCTCPGTLPFVVYDGGEGPEHDRPTGR